MLKSKENKLFHNSIKHEIDRLSSKNGPPPDPNSNTLRISFQPFGTIPDPVKQ